MGACRPRLPGSPAWPRWPSRPTVVVLDQITKALVRRDLGLYEDHEIIPGLVSLVHGRNLGMAFGVLSGGGLPAQAVVLAVLSGAVLLLVLGHWRRLGRRPVLLGWPSP